MQPENTCPRSEESADWRTWYSRHLVSAGEAASYIKSGDRVVTGHGSAEPKILVAAMVARAAELRDVEVTHMLPMTDSPHCRQELAGSFRHNSLFVGASTRQGVQEGWADYTPCFFHEIPALFRDGLLPVDVALVMVSPPDDEGRMSLGISVDYTLEAARCARTVIAAVNPAMPDTGGESYLTAGDIDWFVETDEPLITVPRAPVREVEETIGREVAALVQDGDCLQVGLGAIPDACMKFLHDRSDLGIHSELLGDGVMDLAEAGVITGKRKNFLPGKIVGNVAMGSADFYRWLDHNPAVEMYPADFTNDPYTIGLNDNLVAINSAIAVDLLGQVAADTMGPRQYSGVGGHLDFHRGAARSRGGRAVLAMPATAARGKNSRIVSRLNPGQAVTTTRHDVDYVVTEYGTVRLKGKSLRERSAALIGIAHPSFREQLREECRELYGW